MRIKIYKIIFILIIFSLLMPFYAYASNDTSYVWSEISSPIITTSYVFSEGER